MNFCHSLETQLCTIFYLSITNRPLLSSYLSNFSSFLFLFSPFSLLLSSVLSSNVISLQSLTSQSTYHMHQASTVGVSLYKQVHYDILWVRVNDKIVFVYIDICCNNLFKTFVTDKMAPLNVKNPFLNSSLTNVYVKRQLSLTSLQKRNCLLFLCV